ncbi:MAG: radical SAM protein [Oscillospiraceae bacterium]|nr:radical SAM protein [Oscillospiraceae bacterium]
MEEPLYPLLSLSRLRMGTDGEGVTTLIAGAGCPLSCRWCINKRLLREGKAEPVGAEELLERVRIDDLYFRATGGGVTFGGGESLLHAAFLRRFRELCPAEWRLRAETSLAVDPALLELSIGAVDRYIVDVKSLDDAVYRRYTGCGSALMRQNLRRLLEAVGPEKLTVRVPLIPEFNTSEDQRRSADELRALGVTDLDLFSYVIREYKTKWF